MGTEQPRTGVTSRGRSPDHEYTLSVEDAAELYAEAGLDNDPLRRASEAIASSIAAALKGTRRAMVLPLRGRG